jgi:aspartate/glutamate racemase
MKKRIGCLHAHYSNIQYIEQAFSSCEVELLHFVDPALVYRVSSDDTFSLLDARRKVIEQIEWIVQADVDVILITCTNYIAVLQEDQLSVTVPIIKIDDTFFNDVCNQNQPQILLFTNPATVEGTMKRLYDYANANGKHLDVEAQVIENTFELIMQGKKEQYLIVLSEYIRKLLASNKNRVISVAQLSMVEAVRDIEKEARVKIGNPLESLMTYITENF